MATTTTISHGSVNAFDSKKEEWLSYTDRLSYYFEANGVTMTEMKRAILLVESGLAIFKLVKSLVPEEELRTIEYDALVKVVGDHLEPSCRRSWSITSLTLEYSKKES